MKTDFEKAEPRHDATLENEGAELRSARALEYIAQLLDRIEVHLGTIADRLGQADQNLIANLNARLGEIAKAIQGAEQVR
jgi:hypothetical protein